jgi:Holliday junction DNA helicase RuvA
MISKLDGKIIYVSEKFLVINVGGVGYKVSAISDILATAKIDNEISLWIYTAVRENAIELYGFRNMNELSFFELLLDVSGIGPRSALGILGIAPIETLRRAIATGDTTYLNKVSGIGRKTAEKIIVELRDKFVVYKDDNLSDGEIRDEEDVLEALKSLGYSQNEARDALKKISNETKGANARIKEALRILGGRN